MDFDLESLRLGQSEHVAKERPAPLVRHQRQKGRFLKGPVPLNWLATAGRAPGQALQVANVLAFEVGVEKSQTVKLCHKRLREFGVEKDAASRALRALEGAGLVQVERPPGKSPIVTVLWQSPHDS